MGHPSFLALDRHALCPDAGVVATHLSSCSACRSHVAAAQRELPIPGWIRAGPRSPPRSMAWRWLVPALAVALLAVLVPTLRPSTETQSKGAPSVVLWVKRGEAVSQWEGSKVRPGDALRLEVSGAGYGHLAVVGTDGHVLFRGAAGQRPTLTPAWEVDGPGDERLVVILSRDTLEEAGLTHLASRRDAEVWAVELSLQKEPSE